MPMSLSLSICVCVCVHAIGTNKRNDQQHKLTPRDREALWHSP